MAQAQSMSNREPRRCQLKVFSAMVGAFTAGMLMVISGSVVAQQAYPGKPVHYVVAFAPGDAPDILARLVGDRLSRMWGSRCWWRTV